MTPKELLEYAVIGDFLNDVVPPADIRELARRHGVCTEDFGNPDLAKMVNLYYRNRVPFFNGPIDCRLFIYEGCKLKG